MYLQNTFLINFLYGLFSIRFRNTSAKFKGVFEAKKILIYSKTVKLVELAQLELCLLYKLVSVHCVRISVRSDKVQTICKLSRFAFTDADCCGRVVVLDTDV